MERKAREIMTANVITTKPDVLVISAIKALIKNHISGMPVVDDEGKLIGIITEHDIVNFMLSGDAADTTVSDVMTKNVDTYDPDTPFEEIVSHFAAYRNRRVPVVENGKVVGIISRRDIIIEMNKIYDQLVMTPDTERGHEES
ncbi:HPP family protein [Chloroflexota bacterium]